MVSYKVDFHTHSILSSDGGITKEQYRQILKERVLDFVAVTDHNRIGLALELNQELGEKVVVGEEIKTNQGELIGLYLQNFIPSGLEAKETIKRIKNQGGLVYLPHPFERLRWGVSRNFLPEIIAEVDIIEAFNARSFLNPSLQELINLAAQYDKVCVASSDAHSFAEVGRAYTALSRKPTKRNLVQLLSQAKMETRRIEPLYRLCPTLNRLRKLF
jgi:predicted metal-dependent phosphoesterase TrpH